MIYREQIEERLGSVSHELCVALAIRSALRALPLMIVNQKDNEPFWLQGKEGRDKHLLSVFTASNFYFSFALDPEKYRNTTYATTIFDAIADVYSVDLSGSVISVFFTAEAACTSYAAEAAAFAASHTVQTAEINYARAITEIADHKSCVEFQEMCYDNTIDKTREINVAQAAADVAKANLYSYIIEIEDDLAFIKHISDISSFLQRPLWSQGIPHEIQSSYLLFKRWTRSLVAGFEYWLAWYQQRLDGEPVNLNLLEKHANIPEEIQAKGVKSINTYLATSSGSDQETLQVADSIDRSTGVVVKKSLGASECHTTEVRVNKNMVVNKSEPVIKLFISYSHEDESFKDQLEVGLKGIKRAYTQLNWWDDRQMMSGEWQEQIATHLEKADLVVLLISPDFMASDYCFDIEMEKALVKYEKDGHLVVPIIIRDTPSWNSHKIGKMQALPKDAKPLDQWENADRFWSDVQKGLERTLEQLGVSRHS